jgi:hypothetical protein
VTAEGRRPSAKVLAFKRWIAEEIARTPADFGSQAAARA